MDNAACNEPEKKEGAMFIEQDRHSGVADKQGLKETYVDSKMKTTSEEYQPLLCDLPQMYAGLAANPMKSFMVDMGELSKHKTKAKREQRRKCLIKHVDMCPLLWTTLLFCVAIYLLWCNRALENQIIDSFEKLEAANEEFDRRHNLRTVSNNQQPQQQDMAVTAGKSERSYNNNELRHREINRGPEQNKVGIVYPILRIIFLRGNDNKTDQKKNKELIQKPNESELPPWILEQRKLATDKDLHHTGLQTALKANVVPGDQMRLESSERSRMHSTHPVFRLRQAAVIPKDNKKHEWRSPLAAFMKPFGLNLEAPDEHRNSNKDTPHHSSGFMSYRVWQTGKDGKMHEIVNQETRFGSDNAAVKSESDKKAAAVLKGLDRNPSTVPDAKPKPAVSLGDSSVGKSMIQSPENPLSSLNNVHKQQNAETRKSTMTQHNGQKDQKTLPHSENPPSSTEGTTGSITAGLNAAHSYDLSVASAKDEPIATELNLMPEGAHSIKDSWEKIKNALSADMSEHGVYKSMAMERVAQRVRQRAKSFFESLHGAPSFRSGPDRYLE